MIEGEGSLVPSSVDLPVNGVRYHVRLAGDGPPLVLLHGFTGSGANWESHAATIGRSYRLIAIDLLGHGRSAAPTDPARYQVQRAASDLLTLLDMLGVADFALLGYSMGGRLALHVALAAPKRVRALVLESASPGIADGRERDERIRADEDLAAAIEHEEIEAFIRRWEALSLFASQVNLPIAMRDRLHAQRLENSPIGLANSLRGMGAGVPPPLQDRLVELPMPTLLIVGALDEKYLALSLAMSRQLPQAELAVVPGAGHTVHLEQPVAFDEIVCKFLGKVYAPGETPGEGHS
jgi:2-succinyl-6-hydroxy-2,4-cyclohexadiene-1-carboxylate synthase